jgi:hypothetical protein
MVTARERKLIKSYFFSVPKILTAVLVISLTVGEPLLWGLLFLILLTPSWLRVVMLSLLSIVGIYVVYLVIKRPSDEQVAAWLKEDLEMIKQRALAKLVLNEQSAPADPFVISGPVDLKFDGFRFKDWTLWLRLRRKGRDGRVRASMNKILVILPRERVLAIFWCVFDSVSGVPYHVTTAEYQYKDVVSITVSEDVEVSDGKNRLRYRLLSGRKYTPTQVFRLAFSNGEEILIPVEVSDPADSSKMPELMATDLDKTAAAIRTLVDDPKRR